MWHAFRIVFSGVFRQRDAGVPRGPGGPPHQGARVGFRSCRLPVERATTDQERRWSLPTLYIEDFSAARLYTMLESTSSFICATVSVPMRYTTLSSLASAARTRQLVTLPA